MGAYIEMLPPDRPIFMLGQPIIRLVPSGGPGGELGDVMERAVVGMAGRKGAPPPPEPLPPAVNMKMSGPSALPTSAQSQIEATPTEGNSFVQMPQQASPWRKAAAPQEQSQAPASPWQSQAPASPWQSQAPTASPWQSQASPEASQYQQAVPYDQYQQQQAAAPATDEGFMGSAYITPSDLAGLGCCGSDDSMGALPPEVEAKLLDAKCGEIESTITEIVRAVTQADGDPKLSREQKLVVAKQARQQVRALKATSRGCLRRLKELTRDFRKRLKAAGLEKLEAKVDKQILVEKTKDKLQQIAGITEYGTY